MYTSKLPPACMERYQCGMNQWLDKLYTITMEADTNTFISSHLLIKLHSVGFKLFLKVCACMLLSHMQCMHGIAVYVYVWEIIHTLHIASPQHEVTSSQHAYQIKNR